MNLAQFARRRYTPGATAIEPMPHLTKALGGAELFIKRDDQLGLTGGGNKTRKLEFLVADALAQGADTLITVGAVQSNHCRLTLAAAVREGLKCRLVLEQRVPDSYDPSASGNNFLFDLLGVEAVTVVNLGADLQGAMEQVAADLAAEGRKGYIIPGGGSNALGALGYVACAEEILAQSFASGVAFDRIVVASGSAGTHAGIVAGLVGNSANIPVTGINVRRPRAEQEGNVHKLALAVADLAGVVPAIAPETIECRDEWVGPGYSLPTPEMIEAVRMFASLEGVLLDPVYTGKAAAGLIALVRSGEIAREERVLFVHTGGSPALYAYQPVLAGAAAA
ncbi:D-cysteine desulfhydrase [Sphingomonas mucosissima]|uniref:L-cysteate sulfo-lyase n=1 Tax=Sphingomonas mucosissima TaxID=370959 RepID=A0A245ZRX1_9SPHN|nr:D-cysteine desulfhydrase [Sphingomonas mucosissima]OWK32491.1 L-cysteate sulfo-lyase [Sphingomonas mucosissima]